MYYYSTVLCSEKRGAGQADARVPLLTICSGEELFDLVYQSIPGPLSNSISSLTLTAWLSGTIQHQSNTRRLFADSSIKSHWSSSATSGAHSGRFDAKQALIKRPEAAVSRFPHSSSVDSIARRIAQTITTATWKHDKTVRLTQRPSQRSLL